MTLADDSPATGVPVRVTATINNDQRVLHDDPVTSNQADGSIAFPILVPSDANCLKITVSGVLVSKKGGRERHCVQHYIESIQHFQILFSVLIRHSLIPTG